MTDATDNVAVVRRFFAGFASGDLETVRTEVLAPDVVWHVPGHHPLAGTHVGPDEVVEFFTRLADSKFQVDFQFMKADGPLVVDVHRGWSGRGDGSDIDIIWVLICRVEGGRISEGRSLVSDQAAADSFFHSAYPLARLSTRLAPS